MIAQGTKGAFTPVALEPRNSEGRERVNETFFIIDRFFKCLVFMLILLDDAAIIKGIQSAGLSQQMFTVMQFCLSTEKRTKKKKRFSCFFFVNHKNGGLKLNSEV